MKIELKFLNVPMNTTDKPKIWKSNWKTPIKKFSSFSWLRVELNGVKQSKEFVDRKKSDWNLRWTRKANKNWTREKPNRKLKQKKAKSEKMYPPIASPTSPQDVPMADLNIMNAAAVHQQQHHKQEMPLAIVQQTIKSTHTLRNNIDAKNDTNKKRTSLKLDNGNETSSLHSLESGDSACDTIHQQQRPQRLATVKRCSRNLDNIRYRFECNNNSNSNSNSSSGRGDVGGDSSSTTSTTSTDSDPEATIQQNENGVQTSLNDVDNRKVRRHRRKITDKNIVDDRDVNDVQNGNSSDSTEKRDSVASSKESSDDYFLCEKFKNTLNTKFSDTVDAVVVMKQSENVENQKDVSTVVAVELMSPQEVPLGRRYAEVAPARMNKW